jgi:predicted protein tyrosine phosphatase
MKRLAMTSLRIVCGLDELATHSRSGLTHVLSILDPHYPKPEVFSAFDEHDKLELRFHGAIEPKRGVRLPREKDVAAILEFGERLHAAPNLGQRVVLVHCHAGISRSTAAMAMLIAQAHPELDEEGVFERLIAIRPRAWPNSRMIGYADDLQRRKGRLIEALAGLYRAQIPRIPEIAEYMRDNPMQQFWRQHMLAHAMVENGLYSAGRFLVIAPSFNSQVQHAIHLYRQQLNDAPASVGFDAIPLENVVAAIKRAGAPEIATLLHERYCDYSALDTLI